MVVSVGTSAGVAALVIVGRVVVPGLQLLGVAETRWTSTLRGRLGYLINPTMMLYGTGGLAFMDGRASSGTSYSANHLGWTAGVGLEAMLAPNMTGRVEYRHSDYGTESYGGTDIKVTSNTILLGAALKF